MEINIDGVTLELMTINNLLKERYNNEFSGTSLDYINKEYYSFKKNIKKIEDYLYSNSECLKNNYYYIYIDFIVHLINNYKNIKDNEKYLNLLLSLNLEKNNEICYLNILKHLNKLNKVFLDKFVENLDNLSDLFKIRIYLVFIRKYLNKKNKTYVINICYLDDIYKNIINSVDDKYIKFFNIELMRYEEEFIRYKDNEKIDLFIIENLEKFRLLDINNDLNNINFIIDYSNSSIDLFTKKFSKDKKFDVGKFVIEKKENEFIFKKNNEIEFIYKKEKSIFDYLDYSYKILKYIIELISFEDIHNIFSFNLYKSYYNFIMGADVHVYLNDTLYFKEDFLIIDNNRISYYMKNENSIYEMEYFIFPTILITILKITNINDTLLNCSDELNDIVLTLLGRNIGSNELNIVYNLFNIYNNGDKNYFIKDFYINIEPLIKLFNSNRKDSRGIKEICKDMMEDRGNFTYFLMCTIAINQTGLNLRNIVNHSSCEVNNDEMNDLSMFLFLNIIVALLGNNKYFKNDSLYNIHFNQYNLNKYEIFIMSYIYDELQINLLNYTDEKFNKELLKILNHKDSINEIFKYKEDINDIKKDTTIDNLVRDVILFKSSNLSLRTYKNKLNTYLRKFNLKKHGIIRFLFLVIEYSETIKNRDVLNKFLIDNLSDFKDYKHSIISDKYIEYIKFNIIYYLSKLSYKNISLTFNEELYNISLNNLKNLYSMVANVEKNNIIINTVLDNYLISNNLFLFGGIEKDTLINTIKESSSFDECLDKLKVIYKNFIINSNRPINLILNNKEISLKKEDKENYFLNLDDNFLDMVLRKHLKDVIFLNDIEISSNFNRQLLTIEKYIRDISKKFFINQFNIKGKYFEYVNLSTIFDNLKPKLDSNLNNDIDNYIDIRNDVIHNSKYFNSINYFNYLKVFYLNRDLSLFYDTL